MSNDTTTQATNARYEYGVSYPTMPVRQDYTEPTAKDVSILWVKGCIVLFGTVAPPIALLVLLDNYTPAYVSIPLGVVLVPIAAVFLFEFFGKILPLNQ